jgi:hypothetical protein
MVNHHTERKLKTAVLTSIVCALGDCRLEKQRPRTKESSRFIEIDAEKVDIDLIHRDLEMRSNCVLALYDHFLEKGIIKRV